MLLCLILPSSNNIHLHCVLSWHVLPCHLSAPTVSEPVSVPDGLCLISLGLEPRIPKMAPAKVQSRSIAAQFVVAIVLLVTAAQLHHIFHDNKTITRLEKALFLAV